MIAARESANKFQEAEYSATELRRILQELFPSRKLVLSQFTFYNQIGVARPTGETFKRGRRCYRLVDILPIACILSLKEKGIPLKNIESVPSLVHESASRIFAYGANCFISGYGSAVSLQMPDEELADICLESFLDGHEESASLFWSYDVGTLASRLSEIVGNYGARFYQKAA